MPPVAPAGSRWWPPSGRLCLRRSILLSPETSADWPDAACAARPFGPAAGETIVLRSARAR
jgi:hypothetical protein